MGSCEQPLQECKAKPSTKREATDLLEDEVCKRAAKQLKKDEYEDDCSKFEHLVADGTCKNMELLVTKEEEKDDTQETLASQRQLRDFSVSMPRLVHRDVDLRLLPQQVKAALDFLTTINPLEFVSNTLAAKQPSLLPAQSEVNKGRKTLVLDLDETLVHCHCQPVPLEGSAPIPDLCLELNTTTDPSFPQMMRANVYVRPFARQLLFVAAELFEVVIFTASAAIYADKVLDFLDPNRTLIAHRLYREACTEISGGHFKDLRRLGRPLQSCVLVDNSPLAAGLTPDNGLLVSSWYGNNLEDTELDQVLTLLRKNVAQKSLPEFLVERYGFRSYLEELRRAAGRHGSMAATMARMSLMWGLTSVGPVAQMRR